MAAEEDNFDIDIYGDGGEDYQEEGRGQDIAQQDGTEELMGTSAADHGSYDAGHSDIQSAALDSNVENVGHSAADFQQTNAGAFQANQAQQLQGLKRKEGADDRPLDPGATAALFVSDLHWWITDDDVRGWANQGGCEDELREITFHEHKVNGKSKGFVSFTAPQSKTPVK